MAPPAEADVQPRARTQWPLGVFIGIVWACWDLTAKALLEDRLMYGSDHRQVLTPWLDLRLSYDAAVWPAASLLGSAAATVTLLLLLVRIRRASSAVAISLGLGGFLGDLLDQLPDRTLTHFIALHPFGFAIPPFNFSEVGIGAFGVFAAVEMLRRLARSPADRAFKP